MDAIARDIDRLRDLNLDSADNQINQVIARLEYRLTKAYFRYTMGQNFGFMNPSFVSNRLDTLAPNPYDSSKRPVRFRGLFDVKWLMQMMRSIRRLCKWLDATRWLPS